MTNAAPTPAGGTIINGLYVLTSATWYGIPSGTIGNVALAWNITSTEIQDVDDEMGPMRRQGLTYTTSGTDFTLVADTCPDNYPNGTVEQYTATATTLDFFWKDTSNTTVVFELTKQ